MNWIGGGASIRVGRTDYEDRHHRLLCHNGDRKIDIGQWVFDDLAAAVLY
jgi:hypothetical protein